MAPGAILSPDEAIHVVLVFFYDFQCEFQEHFFWYCINKDISLGLANENLDSFLFSGVHNFFQRLVDASRIYCRKTHLRLLLVAFLYLSEIIVKVRVVFLIKPY